MVNAPGIQEVVIERGELNFKWLRRQAGSTLFHCASQQTRRPFCIPAVCLSITGRIAERWQKSYRVPRRSHCLYRTVKSGMRNIATQEKTIASLEEAVNWRGTQIDELNKGLEWIQKQLADMKEKSASDEKALEWRARQVEWLEKGKSISECDAPIHSTPVQHGQ
jgi:uncharacterized coiled-coil protein SlyX